MTSEIPSPGGNLLVVGSGSAGRRHARNLAAMGCAISCVDPREDRRAELAQEIALVQGFGDVADALADAAESFTGAVVASPTAFHVGQATALLKAGIPVLLEKPVSPGLAEAETLAAVASDAAATGGVPLLLGYTWRWWPPLMEARRRVLAGDLGRIIHARFHMAAHLADWHPWEAYQDWFMVDAAQGGGALLDESHWIDQMLWFFGLPERVFARIGNLSDLQITSDDNVDMPVEYAAGGPRVSMHLDLYARPHVKLIELVGDEGALRWTPNELGLCLAGAGEWQTQTWPDERNDMFVSVAQEFLRLAAGSGSDGPTCDIADGLAVLRVVEAARQASNEGRSVPL